MRDAETPRGIVQDTSTDELDITGSWWGRRGRIDVALVVATIAALAVLLRSLPGNIDGNHPVGYSLGVVLMCMAVIGWHLGKERLNGTTFTTAEGVLSVDTGPFVHRHKAVLNVDHVQQVYVVRVEESLRLRPDRVTFDLFAVSSEQRGDVLLARGIESLEKALFIEAAIEDHLGIADQEIPGSISRQTGRELPREDQPTGFPTVRINEVDPAPSRSSEDELRAAVSERHASSDAAPGDSDLTIGEAKPDDR